MNPAGDPVLLAVAPNGAQRQPADHPALPVTPEALAETAAACRAAGAAMIHLHVRDAQGAHSLDPDRYRAAIAAIRARVGDGLVIQATSEAAGRYRPDEQIAAMRDLAPEACSAALRELAPDAESESAYGAFLAWARQSGVAVQHIVYSAEEAARLRALWQAGVIPDDRPWVLFVLGRHRGASRPADLLPFLAEARDRWRWMVCAFGAAEAGCGLTAAGLGGDVRIGFENNLDLADGTRAADNAALVRQMAGGIALIGRPLADAGCLRQWLAPANTP